MSSLAPTNSNPFQYVNFDEIPDCSTVNSLAQYSSEQPEPQSNSCNLYCTSSDSLKLTFQENLSRYFSS